MLQTFKREYQGDLVTIHVADEAITATGNHPFWVAAGDALSERPAPEHVAAVEPNSTVAGRWVDARDLRVGDHLLLESGVEIAIDELRSETTETTVFNLDVETLHTYAVGLGRFLVHNRPPGGKKIPIAGNQKKGISPIFVVGAEPEDH